MPDATQVQTSFAGGQIGQHAQGRYHDPKIKTALNVCQNGLPLETENWVRRPGTKWAGMPNLGGKGRVIKFDFEEETPAYAMVHADGVMGFLSGATPVTTNDNTAISSISAANPAVMLLASAVTWNTGDRGFITGLSPNPVLENRWLVLTKIDTTHFSLADAVTGAAINGATLSAIGSNAVFQRLLYVTTPYAAGAWSSLRAVQSDADGTPVSVLLQGSFPPQALSVTSEPNGSNFATFQFGPATFQDGPYLDPPTNGAQLTANQQTGIVQLTLSYPAYVSTTSYAADDIVTSSSVNYVSLVDQNVGNTPSSSPTKWAQTNGNAAVNNGQGFLPTDVGRLIRLFSEPALWNSGSSYSAGQIVSYNPSENPGQTTYWSFLSGGTGSNFPGKTTTDWQLLQQGGDNSPALWTWGVIESLINFIPGAPVGIVHIGNMTQNAGLAAAFDGTTDQNAASSASLLFQSPPNTFENTMTVDGYIGQNYSGCSPSGYKVQSATIFATTDQYLLTVSVNIPGVGATTLAYTLVAYLYASNSPPANSGDGTVIGEVIIASGAQFTVPRGLNTFNCFGADGVTIYSTDQSTTYSYVWVRLVGTVVPAPGFSWENGYIQVLAGQVEFVAAPGSAVTANGINVELLGPALLYSSSIRTWRLGKYSNTTGYPTCGTWTDGRLWLGGAIPNRVDGCVSNGITVDSAGTTINFAPTDQYGNVLDSSAIDIAVNLPEANPFIWMMPNEQGICCGTKSRETLIFPPTAGGFSPTNVDNRMLTRIGSANIEPVQCEHTFVYVQRYLRKIVEYFADVFSGKFTAPNLIKDAKNLTVGGIQELAYQQELVPVIWARVGNALIGCTYKRDTLMTSSGPTMDGWHPHPLGSGRQVESICTGSSLNGTLDALTMVTNDTSTNVRFVEVLSDILDEGSLPSASPYLDAAIVPTSTSAVAATLVNGSPGGAFPYGGLQLNGLWPHNGKTVTALLGGLDCGDYIVSNGMIQVPYGDGIGNGQGSFPAAANRNDQGLFTAAFVSTGITANSNTLWTGTMPMLVGFTFTSRGQLLRPFQPQDAGSRNGPAFGKLHRSHYIMAQFEGAGNGVQMGFAFDNTLEPAIFTAADAQTPLTVDQQFSGVFRDQFECEYTFDTRVSWQVTRPIICNVQAIGPALETADV